MSERKENIIADQREGKSGKERSDSMDMQKMTEEPGQEQYSEGVSLPAYAHIPYYRETGGGLKGFFIRLIRKLLRPVILPMVEQQNAFNAQLVKEMQSVYSDMGAMSRQIMLAKWKTIDHLRTETEKDEDILTCNICGKSQKRSAYKTMEADCIYNGGHLVRYVCPECGVIFGPSKFTDQGQRGIDEDYWVHYLGFTEGDSSYKEERAFRMLNPTKKGIYLNYGCGKWSKTLQKLRNEGYNVYGYEPYAPEDDNPYLITSREDLEKMRFDGIFSNDVLEHFIDPVQDLRFMRGLLSGPSSRMSHCTACYTYKYEYTRFHTHFFLGDSVKILAEKAGLKISECCDDMAEHDFYCYVFEPTEADKPADINCSILPDMVPAKNCSAEDGHFVMMQGGLLCGPYMFLPAGSYTVAYQTNPQDPADPDSSIGKYRVTSNKGRNVITEGEVRNGCHEIRFSGRNPMKDFEVVIESQAAFTVSRLELSTDH